MKHFAILMSLAALAAGMAQAVDDGDDITFVSDGKTVETRWLYPDLQLGTLPNVSKPGYALVGWFDTDVHQVTETTLFQNLRSYTITAHWLALPSVATVVASACSDEFRLDTREGARESTGTETLAYSALWSSNSTSVVTISQSCATPRVVNGPLVSGLVDEGEWVWNAPYDGEYTLTHAAVTGGVTGAVETAVFVVGGLGLPQIAMTVTGCTNVYDGTSRTIDVETDTIDGLVLRYCTAPAGSGMENGEWRMENSPPQFTDVTNVVIYVEVSAPGYCTKTNCAAVKITKRPVTFTGKSETKTFIGSEIEITTVVVSNLVASHTHNVAFSAKSTDVGQHTGTITAVDAIRISGGDADVTANYDITVVNGALTIVQDPVLALEVSLAGASFTFDGQPHALPGPATHTAASGVTTVEYSKDQSSWTADLSALTATDVADSCTIHVRASNPNYANTATATATLTITRADVGGGADEPGGGEVPVGGVSKFDASFAYDGKGHTIDTNALVAAFSAAMGESTGFAYALDDGGAPAATWTADAPAFVNAGEYVVWYKASNPNYEDFVHAAKVTITKAANAWITAPSMAGWTVGAAPASPNKGQAKFGTATVAYGKAGGAAGGLGATRPSAAGSYVATFTVPGTANYGSLVKNVSFTIKAKPKTYKVKFSANGGKLPKGKTMAAQTFTPGKAKKLRGNAFVRKGYVFIGWSTRKNGPIAYKNGRKVKNLAKAGKTVTLYAVWAKETYKVVFDASGGRGKMPVQAFKYGRAQKLYSNKFTRKGYVFGGWAIRDPLATIPKIAYKNGQAVKNLSRNGGTVKLYAVWKRR